MTKVATAETLNSAKATSRNRAGSPDGRRRATRNRCSVPTARPRTANWTLRGAVPRRLCRWRSASPRQPAPTMNATPVGAEGPPMTNTRYAAVTTIAVAVGTTPKKTPAMASSRPKVQREPPRVVERRAASPEVEQQPEHQQECGVLDEPREDGYGAPPHVSACCYDCRITRARARPVVSAAACSRRSQTPLGACVRQCRCRQAMTTCARSRAQRLRVQGRPGGADLTRPTGP